MTVEFEILENGQKVHIRGPLTIYGAAQARDRFLQALRAGADIEIDLSAVDELDTAGFQLLLALKQEGRRKGCDVRLVGHSRAVLEVIDLYHMAAELGDPLVIPAESGAPY